MIPSGLVSCFIYAESAQRFFHFHMRAELDFCQLYRVSQTSSVKDGPRPYLVVCTVHGVQFRSEAQLKAFTRAQEEWHKEIGQMRRRATLATHDLSAVRFPLLYTMRQSDQVLVKYFLQISCMSSCH